MKIRAFPIGMIILAFLSLNLASCGNVSVSPASTPPATQTNTPEIPSPTPAEPLSPAFIDLQEQIAQSDIYTLTKDGFEMKNPDGTITLIPNIKPNIFDEDLTFTITYAGQEFIVEFDSIKEKDITFTGEEDRKWVWNGNNLVRSYTENEISQMTPEQKLAAAPEIIDDLERSNLSTVPDKDYLVLYRNKEGIAIKVLNLLTAEELSLTDAGIIEFIMKDGQRLEMAYFEETQEAIDYAYLVRGASGSTRENMQYKEAIKKYQMISGVNGSNFPEEFNREYISGYEVLFDSNNRNNIAFGVGVVSILDGSFISFYSKNTNDFENIFINQVGSVVGNAIGRGTVTAPIVEN